MRFVNVVVRAAQSGAACLWSIALTAAADDFTPVDDIVSKPGVALSDPEFDQVGYHVAWQFGPTPRASGKLLVADVDPNNGDILDPATGIPLSQGGSGLLVDTDLVERVGQTGNGPEWAYGAAGSQILYTRYNELGQMHIARAIHDGIAWRPQLLERGENRTTPKGSRDLDDPAPRVAYIRFRQGDDGVERRLGVRTIDVPDSERNTPESTGGGNFLLGESAFLTTSKPTPESQQVFVFQYDTGEFVQVTTDPGVKAQSPEPWIAPDVGGNMAFVANSIHRGFSAARIYRRPDPSDNFTWTLIAEIRSPVAEKPYLKSPRPFVFEDKSYLVFSVQEHPTLQTNPEIWISDIERDPDTRFYRRVSETTTGVRFDPENFMTLNGPIVYYSYVADGDDQMVLRRAQTGLIIGQNQAQ